MDVEKAWVEFDRRVREWEGVKWEQSGWGEGELKRLVLQQEVTHLSNGQPWRALVSPMHSRGSSPSKLRRALLTPVDVCRAWKQADKGVEFTL